MAVVFSKTKPHLLKDFKKKKKKSTLKNQIKYLTNLSRPSVCNFPLH